VLQTEHDSLVVHGIPTDMDAGEGQTPDGDRIGYRNGEDLAQGPCDQTPTQDSKVGGSQMSTAPKDD